MKKLFNSVSLGNKEEPSEEKIERYKSMANNPNIPDFLRKQYAEVASMMERRSTGVDYFTLDPEGELPHREYTWEDEYNVISRTRRTARSTTQSNPNPFKRKDSYKLNECLKAFRELTEKEIGEIYLTGSVALHLQKIIKRNIFKDVDIVLIGNHQFDDDITPYKRDSHYPQSKELGDPIYVTYSNIPIDIFKFKKEHSIKVLPVEYKGDVYICQDFREILMAKLNMLLPKMKDVEEILPHLDINFK